MDIKQKVKKDGKPVFQWDLCSLYTPQKPLCIFHSQICSFSPRSRTGRVLQGGNTSLPEEHFRQGLDPARGYKRRPISTFSLFLRLFYLPISHSFLPVHSLACVFRGTGDIRGTGRLFFESQSSHFPGHIRQPQGNGLVCSTQ